MKPLTSAVASWGMWWKQQGYVCWVCEQVSSACVQTPHMNIYTFHFVCVCVCADMYVPADPFQYEPLGGKVERCFCIVEKTGPGNRIIRWNTFLFKWLIFVSPEPSARSKSTQGQRFCACFMRMKVLFFSLLQQHAYLTETLPYQCEDLRGQLIFNANITIWYHSNWAYCGSSGWVKLLINFCWCERERKEWVPSTISVPGYTFFKYIEVINVATYNYSQFIPSVCDWVYELLMRFAWGVDVYPLGTIIKTKALCELTLNNLLWCCCNSNRQNCERLHLRSGAV